MGNNTVDLIDIERVYDAFTQLCEYVERDTKIGCGKCPHRNACFGKQGHSFAESLKKIQEEVKEIRA